MSEISEKNNLLSPRWCHEIACFVWLHKTKYIQFTIKKRQQMLTVEKLEPENT